MKLALLVVVLIGGTASAQSPRAGGPAPGDDPASRIAVEGAIGGNIARGFVDRELISARGILQGWSGPWGLYIQPYYLFGRIGTPAGKLTTDNEVYVRTGLFRTVAEPLFVYAVDAYDHSLRRQIEHRNLSGGGLGVNIYRKAGTSLVTSVGVLYEVTDFGATGNPDPPLEDGSIGDIRQTMRWSVRLYGRYKLAGGKLGLVHDLIVIPSFRDPANDYRILFLGAIDAPIAKGFAFRVQADATREGLIVQGTQKDDLVVTFNVAYKNEWAAKQPPPP